MVLNRQRGVYIQVTEYFPYQEKGAEFLAARFRGYLFDDMGLGKSAQAILAADKVQAENILVICPATARINWGREFRKFQNRARSVNVILSSRQSITDAVGVTVVNYDLVHKKAIWNRLIERKWDVVIIDESHFLKEAEALRTQAVYGHTCDGSLCLVDQAIYVWVLSGTPMLNNPLELWPMLHALTPQAIEYNGKPLSWWQFLNRYCVYKEDKWQKIKIVKGRNLEELNGRIKPYFLRRLKKHVLKDLPPVTVSCFAMDVGGTFSHLKELESHPEVQVLREWLEQGKELTLDQWSTLLDSEHMATLCRYTGIIKAQAVVELLKDELECGLDKIVLMAWHRDAIQIMYEALNSMGYKTVRLWGGDSPKAQQEAIDGFQNDPEIRVFIGQIAAAGQAITLTAASQLMFVESSWSPTINDQVRDRVHRIGQTYPVFVRFAYLPGSIDEPMTAVIARKMDTINRVLN